MSGLLSGLKVILVQPRFPENIGMAARACANMACPDLCIVEPERWDMAKAAPLATAQGTAILERICLATSLQEAIADQHLLTASTARTGGWRREILEPAQCARLIAEVLGSGQKAALIFGPEDRGLRNADILCAHYLCHIPCAPKAKSLNLAQAVLLLLYECSKAMRELNKTQPQAGMKRNCAKPINAQEYGRLLDAFKAMLLSLDALHGANPDYFMLPWRGLFNRTRLRRHEYDALMGLCRQVRHKLS